MSENLPNEEAFIAEALRRRRLNEPTIPAEKMKRFRTLLIQEIKRTGQLSKEFANRLLHQLWNGEL